MTIAIPVICDRCRAEGLAGGEGFTDLGGLLDFEPVPRKIARADGWTPDVQRAFILARAITGSDRQAARAVGKAQYGVDQLKKAKGNESFMRAYERAGTMAAQEKSHRLAAGLNSVAAPAACWRPPTPAWSGAATRRALPAPADSAPSPAEPPDPRFAHVPQEMLAELELTGEIIRKYMLKLQAERRCRLEGRIAEADFYLRQITMVEIALDTVSGQGMALLRDVSREGHDLLQIAETDMSRRLDEARRKHWEACGDPPRPEYPPRHLLVEHDGYATEPLPTAYGLQPGHEERRRQIEEQFASDAEAQVEWEALARRDYERRQGSDAAS